MYKQFYTRFLKGHEGVLHFASHSHYFWPDVTREAQLQYWDDSARLSDSKWEEWFQSAIPQASEHIARIIGVGDPEQIVFAPNTHELLYRLFSCLPLAEGKPTNILTTDSEFHSCRRQLARLSELDAVQVEVVPAEPFETFTVRFTEKARSRRYDSIFLSRVFFNSGVVVPAIDEVLPVLFKQSEMVILDDYHGFMAIPISLRGALEEQLFYLAGSYKYVQAGEGMCFLYSPPGTTLRPLNTGWFADFAGLADSQDSTVGYAENGMRFAGATMDFSALYRFNAVAKLYEEQGLTIEKVYAHVRKLQKVFLNILQEVGHPDLNSSTLVVHDLGHHGHFLSFDLGSADKAQQLYSELKVQRVVTDVRGARIRFGFGLYHDESDIQSFSQRLRTLVNR